MILSPGNKVWFAEEKQAYKVIVRSSRYVILTKPFNLRKTVFYTIIDEDKGIRGVENLVFGMGFETDEQCIQALARLDSGETEISRRNNIPVNIVRIK